MLTLPIVGESNLIRLGESIHVPLRADATFTEAAERDGSIRTE